MQVMIISKLGKCLKHFVNCILCIWLLNFPLWKGLFSLSIWKKCIYSSTSLCQSNIFWDTLTWNGLITPFSVMPRLIYSCYSFQSVPFFVTTRNHKGQELCLIPICQAIEEFNLNLKSWPKLNIVWDWNDSPKFSTNPLDHFPHRSVSLMFKCKSVRSCALPARVHNPSACLIAAGPICSGKPDS